MAMTIDKMEEALLLTFLYCAEGKIDFIMYDIMS